MIEMLGALGILALIGISVAFIAGTAVAIVREILAWLRR